MTCQCYIALPGIVVPRALKVSTRGVGQDQRQDLLALADVNMCRPMHAIVN